MLLTIHDVLNPAELSQIQDYLKKTQWADGKHTAGYQSAQVKNNYQLSEDAPYLSQLRNIIMNALMQNATFVSAALPKQIFPPLFNRYTGAANHFGWHVDGAMRPLVNGTGYLRTDISATLFLADPDTYDGGELVIRDTFGEHAVKLPAGSLVLYPSSSVHEVRATTRGERLACFLWLESMVRCPHQRRMLYDLDMALLELRSLVLADGSNIDQHGALVALTGTYHNLLRMWGESR